MTYSVNHSRWCHRCEINWPNNVTGFHLCQVCGAATQVNANEQTFDTPAQAWAYAAAEKDRRTKYEAFEDYCKGSDEYLVQAFIGQIPVIDWTPEQVEARDKRLAAQFAKLREHPTKEVTDG